ncbi:MAG: hypothetical protein RI894_580 [Bacteroidota bacterium]|jgi:hypothetical protein
MKLLSLWSLLSATTRLEIRAWIAALQPKLRQDALKLLAYLNENAAISEADWQRETVFAYLYGNDVVYNDDWLRHAQSLLVKAIEQAIAAKKWLQEPIDAAFYIAEFYVEEKEGRYFQAAYKQLQQLNETTFPKNQEHFYRLAQAENLYFRHITDGQRVAVNNLEAIMEAQEKHFAAAQLRTACTALSYQNFFKTSYDFGLLPALLQRIEARNWQQTEPIIGAYYFIYKMTTEITNDQLTDDYFAAFRQNMPQYAALFDKNELRDTYISGINYVIKRVNKGDKTYFRPLYDLYKEGIENGVLLADDGSISAFTYGNMVATGLRIGETDYIFSFLQKYKNALPRDTRNMYYQYALARYYYRVRDFANALPCLLKLTYSDIFLQLDTKVILLKIYYETDDLENLEAHLRSFQQFLLRKKTQLGYHQQNYLNIIACAKQLTLTNWTDKAEKIALKTLLETMQPLTEREWFLETVAASG